MNGAVWAVMVTALIIASVTDVRTKTIPIPTFPAAFLTCLVIRTAAGNMYADYWVGMAIMFVISVNLCLFASFGGGDLLMLTAVGFAAGASGAVVFSIASAVISMGVFLYLLAVRRGGKRIAMAPVVLASYCVTILISILYTA